MAAVLLGTGQLKDPGYWLVVPPVTVNDPLLHTHTHTHTQGVRAIIAESYERIHRSNLIGMGIIPLQYLQGQSAETLQLTGRESYSIDMPHDLLPGQLVDVKVYCPDTHPPSSCVCICCLFLLYVTTCRYVIK